MDNKIKILITSTSFQDVQGEHHKKIRSFKFEIDFLRGPLPESSLIDIIHNYDGIICGDDEITSKVIKNGISGKLKVISKYGVGLDKIDLEYAKKHNLPVTNCPGVNQDAVSEHVFGLLLSYIRNIPSQWNETKNYGWNRMIGQELSGKSIGIIGLGNIGKSVANLAKAFKMEVYTYDIKPDMIFINNNQINLEKSIEIVFEKCDIVSLHVDLNEKTRKLINHSILNQDSTSIPILVNTCRSEVIDSEALLYSLENNKIRAYLTDVLDDEPIKKDNKLISFKNVYVTPHIGSRTYESAEKQAMLAINNLINALNE